MKGKKNQGEMYSPNESGEYMPCGDTPNFTVQGLQDALTKTESVVTGATSSCRQIHHSIGSDYGGSTQEAMTTSLLMEWRL